MSLWFGTIMNQKWFVVLRALRADALEVASDSLADLVLLF